MKKKKVEKERKSKFGEQLNLKRLGLTRTAMHGVCTALTAVANAILGSGHAIYFRCIQKIWKHVHVLKKMSTFLQKKDVNVHVIIN